MSRDETELNRYIEGISTHKKQQKMRRLPMFLTTEPTISGKNYDVLRVIFATVTVDTKNNVKTHSIQWDAAIENALGKLHANAINSGADGVIGVHISTSQFGGWVSATVMGTAIKFPSP
jgi:uncharacterized protein YbjQ (UPF0145 family)